MSFSSIYINRHSIDQPIVTVYDTEELKRVAIGEIERLGYDCSLNHIDVSHITNFDGVFSCRDAVMRFIGDISEWDVSNGVSFKSMFNSSDFNGNISKWDMRSAKCLDHMFAYSKFNKDISFWQLPNALTAEYMFVSSAFNKDISCWDMSNLCNISGMFMDSVFDKDVSCWNVSRCICADAFAFQHVQRTPPKWFTDWALHIKPEIDRMKQLDWHTNDYSVITYEQLKSLDSGKHCISVNYDNGEVVGHLRTDTPEWHVAYEFEKRENISNLELGSLYRKIREQDFLSFNCVYEHTFKSFYPYDFYKAFKPFTADISRHAYNKYRLYLVNCINWHAEKAMLPCIKRNKEGVMEYCKNL